jgi:predicted transcriptional regulator YdeE
METPKIKGGNFYIVGISCRTTNKGGQSGKDIGELWDRFYQEKIMESIPNKVEQGVYNIYADYESDHMGPYTCILGCKVTSLDTVPVGLIGIHVPEAIYQVYTAKGKLPDCVMNTWQNIWQQVNNRAFGTDFDYYGAEARDMANAKVETWLSVK